MPRATATKRKATEDVDSMIALSQQSASSDDSGNMLAAVAQQMQVSWEKKKKEKESKFIQLVKRELDKTITQTARRFTTTVEEMNTAYEKFVVEYASVEDEIRALWTGIMREQHAFIDLAREKRDSGVEREKEREERQLDGMASCKRACEDLGTIIESLTASS